MGCNTTTLKQPVQLKQKYDHSGATELKKNYKIDKNSKILGKGAYGKVYLSENRTNPNLKVAIKVLNKTLIGNDIKCLLEEIKILHKLDHPNIVKYFETYEDQHHMYLIMEYCNGGELFD